MLPQGVVRWPTNEAIAHSATVVWKIRVCGLLGRRGHMRTKPSTGVRLDRGGAERTQRLISHERAVTVLDSVPAGAKQTHRPSGSVASGRKRRRKTKPIGRFNR